MPKYETVAGQVTMAETYSKIIHLLSEVEDLCYAMGHLHSLQDSPHELDHAAGWRGIGELIHRQTAQITKLATGKLRL